MAFLFYIFVTLNSYASEGIIFKSENLDVLFDSGKYLELIYKIESYQWNSKSDPKDLMQYCFALNELNKNFPSSFKAPHIPNYIENFSIAYSSLLKGDAVKANAIFRNIKDEGVSGYWKYIGLLEYSIWTGSTKNMLPQILMLKKLHHTHDKAFNLIPYYEIYTYFMNRNLKTASILLNKYKLNLDEFFYIELKVDILINKNKITKASELLNRLEGKRSLISNLAVQKSELLDLLNGNLSSIDYLYEYLSENPNAWSVKREIAYWFLRNNDNKKGMSLLNEILIDRPLDYYYKLSLLDVLLDYGQTDDDIKLTKRIMKDIYENHKLVGIVDYHILVAKILNMGGKIKEAYNQLEYVSRIAPNNNKLLWMYFDLFLGEKKYKKALQINKKMLLLDPNNNELLINRTKLNTRMPEFNPYRIIGSDQAK